MHESSFRVIFKHMKLARTKKWGMNKKMGETTIGRITREKQKQEREALEKATDKVFERVLKLSQARELKEDTEDADNPLVSEITSLEVSLLIIRYGSFFEVGFFKLLRNTSPRFWMALGTSILAGFVTWTILNIKSIWPQLFV